MIVILARPPRCSLYTSNSRSAMATTTRRAAVRIRPHSKQSSQVLPSLCRLLLFTVNQVQLCATLQSAHFGAASLRSLSVLRRFCPASEAAGERSVRAPTARRSEVSALSPPTTTALRRRVPPWHA